MSDPLDGAIPIGTQEEPAASSGSSAESSRPIFTGATIKGIHFANPNAPTLAATTQKQEQLREMHEVLALIRQAQSLYKGAIEPQVKKGKVGAVGQYFAMHAPAITERTGPDRNRAAMQFWHLLGPIQAKLAKVYTNRIGAQILQNLGGGGTGHMPAPPNWPWQASFSQNEDQLEDAGKSLDTMEKALNGQIPASVQGVDLTGLPPDATPLSGGKYYSPSLKKVYRNVP